MPLRRCCYICQVTSTDTIGYEGMYGEVYILCEDCKSEVSKGGTEGFTPVIIMQAAYGKLGYLPEPKHAYVWKNFFSTHVRHLCESPEMN
jgi:hypothetical protein